MWRRWLALAVVPILGGLIGLWTQPAGSQQIPPRHLLYFTATWGFRHGSIPLSHSLMIQLGRESKQFDVTVTEDVRLLNADFLRYFDAVMFNTTGEIPLTEEQKQALLDFVRSGKGFVGVHAATDTFYKWPAFGELIGGYFDGHPWHQEVNIIVEDRNHPSTRHLGESFKITDEIYQYRDWSRDKVHVLLRLDVNSVDLSRPGVKRKDKDFALAWTKTYGKGRVFYTALGHRDEVWQDGRFQRHLVNGILWAMGALD